MLYLYVKQQQSEKRCHFHPNENKWTAVGAAEIQLSKSSHVFYWIFQGIVIKRQGRVHRNNSLHNFSMLWSPDSDQTNDSIFFLSQQPTTQPGIHFKVTATPAVDLLQHRFNAAVISNPTHSCGTEITAPNMSHHELKWSALSCRYLITK